MVTDQQVRRLYKLIQTEKNFGIAAMKAGMDEKTARKYRKQGKLPSGPKRDHVWRTRKDPFGDIWDGIKSMLEINPGLEAKTLFDDLQQRQPGRFADGQLRTLQRRVKHWRHWRLHPKRSFLLKFINLESYASLILPIWINWI